MYIEDDKPKFFGRRQGRKIRKAKSCLLDNFLPKVILNPEKPLEFGIKPKKVYLEIGFGDGGHLAAYSEKHKDIGFIGAEVFKNGIANMLSLLTGVKEGDDICETINLLTSRTDNVRIFDNDIRLLFPIIPDSSIDKIFLLFPDPWPKKRHAARRFINPANLKEITRILKKNGVFMVATDHMVYKYWTLRQMHLNKNFVWTAACGDDWKKEPEDWVQTKYQQKALHEGRKPIFFEFKKL